MNIQSTRKSVYILFQIVLGQHTGVQSCIPPLCPGYKEKGDGVFSTA